MIESITILFILMALVGFLVLTGMFLWIRYRVLRNRMTHFSQIMLDCLLMVILLLVLISASSAFRRLVYEYDNWPETALVLSFVGIMIAWSTITRLVVWRYRLLNNELPRPSRQ